MYIQHVMLHVHAHVGLSTMYVSTHVIRYSTTIIIHTHTHRPFQAKPAEWYYSQQGILTADNLVYMYM